MLDTLGISHQQAEALLHGSEIVGYQAVPTGTNYTFIMLMQSEGHGGLLAVYKPGRGENPLWDFPDGSLYRREHAAYTLSRHLGWPSIPCTVIRDGPFGKGSVQLYVPQKPEADFFSFRGAHARELMEIALFDLLTNNADRKAGHCLLGLDDRVWAIDHGLTFNVDPKLRTVLWDFCDQPIPSRLAADVEALQTDRQRREVLVSDLRPDLSIREIDVFFQRLDRMTRMRNFPRLDPHRNVPWPLV